MNIVIYNPQNGRSHVRPDTSWEKENKDLYVPQDVDGYWFAPILFAKICKAGKCIGGKFAERYYDSIGFGALLYAGEDAVENLLSASCHDHTTVLPFPMIEKEAFEDAAFSVFCDGVDVFSSGMDGEMGKKLIREALCNATAHISLRIGDLIAVQMDEMKHLVKVDEGSTHTLMGKLGEEKIFDFNVIK